MRPETVEDVIEEIHESVLHAGQVAIETRYTNDVDEPIDPIHAYAKELVRDAVPLAIIGLFLIQHRFMKESGDVAS